MSPSFHRFHVKSPSFHGEISMFRRVDVAAISSSWAASPRPSAGCGAEVQALQRHLAATLHDGWTSPYNGQIEREREIDRKIDG